MDIYIIITNMLNIISPILSASHIYTRLYRHKWSIILASSSPIPSWKLCRFLQAFIRSATCHGSDSSRRMGWHGIMQTVCISRTHTATWPYMRVRYIGRCRRVRPIFQQCSTRLLLDAEAQIQWLSTKPPE